MRSYQPCLLVQQGALALVPGPRGYGSWVVPGWSLGGSDFFLERGMAISVCGWALPQAFSEPPSTRRRPAPGPPPAHLAWQARGHGLGATGQGPARGPLATGAGPGGRQARTGRLGYAGVIQLLVASL